MALFFLLSVSDHRRTHTFLPQVLMTADKEADNALDPGRLQTLTAINRTAISQTAISRTATSRTAMAEEAMTSTDSVMTLLDAAILLHLFKPA
jgi:hypothetical protein